MTDERKKRLLQILDKNDRLNHLRELLQVTMIKRLKDAGFFKQVAFVGGTALRLAHGLERFSEDLDFVSLDAKKSSKDWFNHQIVSLVHGLKLEGYSCRHSAIGTKTLVWRTFIVFEKILGDLKVVQDSRETLQIRIELDSVGFESIDTDFSVVADSARELIVPNVPLGSLSALFGGKLHAILFRPYTKGRDWFDLDWFLRKGTAVDIGVIRQTERNLGRDTKVDLEPVRRMLLQRIQELDTKAVIEDVRDFVENPEVLREIFDKDRLRFLAEKITARDS